MYRDVTVPANAANLHSSRVLLARAVELSSQVPIGVYDCLYVALAEQESCDLVTADQRLITKLGFPFIKSLASFPWRGRVRDVQTQHCVGP